MINQAIIPIIVNQPRYYCTLSSRTYRVDASDTVVRGISSNSLRR